MAKTALGTKVANNPGHAYIIIPEFPKAQLNQKAYYYVPSPITVKQRPMKQLLF